MSARLQQWLVPALLALGALFAAAPGQGPTTTTAVDPPAVATQNTAEKSLLSLRVGSFEATLDRREEPARNEEAPYLQPLNAYFDISNPAPTEKGQLEELRRLIVDLELEASAEGRKRAEPAADERGKSAGTTGRPAAGKNDRASNQGAPSIPSEADGAGGSPTSDPPHAVTFLIVTMPHPQLAGSDYLTDALLETLRRSIEAPRKIFNADEEEEVAEGSILDRYWLPWKSSNAKADELGRFAQLGPGQPGILIFRRLSGMGLVAALVVSEHPALGVDRAAMAKALRAIHALQGETEKIRILGPTFTGTQDSLAQSLRAFYEREPNERHVQLVNGSATSFRLQRFKERLGANCTVYYSTTVIPDEVLQDHLLYFLAGEPESVKQEGSGSAATTAVSLSAIKSVALLVESDTGFGQQNAKLMNRLEGRGIELTVIPFPQQVSSVLATYQARRQKAVEGMPQLLSSEIEIGIPFETQDMRYRRLQPFEPQLTAVRVGLLLREITRSLREQRAQYVGIIATRSLDKLLLAAMVRQSCPDVRLFTTVGDVLFSHSNVSTDLTGMVVASTYPLYRTNQEWTGEHATHLQTAFGHQSELGLYNALQVLLETPDGMVEYSSPFKVADGGAASGPPVWISIVGRDAVYPVRCYNLADSPLKDVRLNLKDKDDEQSKRTPVAEAIDELYGASRSSEVGSNVQVGKSLDDPGASLAWLVLCTASAILALLACNKAVHLPRQRLERLWPCQIFAAAAIGTLLVFCTYAAWLLRGVAWTRLNYSTTSKVEVWLALLGVFGSFIYVVWRSIPQLTKSERALHTQRFLVRLLFIGAALALGFMAMKGFSSEAILDATRTVNVRGGLSPLAPLFFWMVTFTWLCYEQCRRQETTIPPCRLHSPLLLPEHDAFKELRSHLAGVESRLATSWEVESDGKRDIGLMVRDCVVPAAVIALGLVGAVDIAQRSSLDGRVHRILCAFFFLGAVGIIAIHLTWLRNLWRDLRQLLLQMGRLPCVGAFDRLPHTFRPFLSGGLFNFQRQPWGSAMTVLLQQFRAVEGVAIPVPTKAPTPADWTMLNEALRKYLEELADAYWPKRTMGQAYPPASISGKSVETWADWNSFIKKENFAAAMLFGYTMPFLLQVRQLVRAVVVGSILVILALWSYPFIPSISLRTCAWVLAILAAHRALRIATQLNSNEIVSRVAGTAPNKVTWDLGFINTLVTTLGPLIALLLYSFFGLPSEVLEWFRRLTGR